MCIFGTFWGLCFEKKKTATPNCQHTQLGALPCHAPLLFVSDDLLGIVTTTWGLKKLHLGRPSHILMVTIVGCSLLIESIASTRDGVTLLGMSFVRKVMSVKISCY